MKDNRQKNKKSIDGMWLTIGKFMNVQIMPKPIREMFYDDVELITDNMLNEMYRIYKKYEKFTKLKQN